MKDDSQPNKVEKARRPPSGGPLSSPKPWHLPALTVGALGLAAVLFFTVYVSSRTAYLIERDFRLLGDMSGQVSESLVNLHTALVNALKTPTNSLGADSLTNVLSQIEPRVTVNHELALTNQNDKRFFLSAITNTDIGQVRRLSFTYTNAATNFAASVDLGELLRPILSRYDFADILLAETNGGVVFQLSQSEERATNAAALADLRLTRLPAFDADAGTNLAIRGTCLLERVQVAGTTYKLFAQPLRVSLGETEATRIEWVICGLIRARDFKTETWELPTTSAIAFILAAIAILLLWPFLNILFSGPGDEVRGVEVAWVLIGAFLGSAALTFVLLYSNAYLRSERTSDEELEQFAEKVQSNLTNELAKADALLAHLNEHLAAQASEACLLASTNAWSALKAKTNASKDVPAFSNYPVVIEVAWANKNGEQIAKWTPRNALTAYIPVGDRPYFQSIVGDWAWPNIWGTPNSAAGARDSFYLESIFSRTRGENLAAFARPFHTTNDWPAGECPAKKDYFPQPVASVLIFKPLSLFSPILPAGYGFCIIEASGRVLFHSDGRRNLRENFIAEAGQDRRLQAAVNARRSDDFDVRYLNLTHHTHARPVSGLPWTIVVFRNEHILDGVHRNILITASALYGCYLAALILVLLLKSGVSLRRGTVSLTDGNGWLRWLWPDAPSHARYVRRGLVAGLGASLGLMAIVAAPSPQFLLAGVLLGPVTIFARAWLGWLVPLGLRRKIAPLKRALLRTARKRFRFLRARFTPFELWLSLMLVFLAMVPAFACYKIAYLQETEAYVKGIQLKLAREFQQRPVEMSRKAGKWGTGEELTDYWTAARAYSLTNSWNQYVKFFDETVVPIPGTVPASSNLIVGEAEWFEKLYDTIRPRFAETELRTSGLLRTQADDDSWRSRVEVQNERLGLTLKGGDILGGGGTVELSSRVPRMGWPTLSPFEADPIWHYCWYAALLLLFVVPLGCARFIARHLLLFDLPANLRRPRLSRHMRLAAPKANPAAAGARGDPFVATEWAYIKAEPRLDCLAEEKATVFLVSAATPAEADQWVQKLDSSRLRTNVALFERHSAGSEKSWTLDQGSNAVPGRGGDEVERRRAVAARLSEEYGKAWGDCTAREKLTLYQVAKTGFTGFARPELRTLLERRLLRFGPELCLRNESFRRFVLIRFPTGETTAELKGNEPEGPLSWRAIRGPVGLVLSAGALFLFATQKELWQLAVGMAASFATASQGLAKITSLFQKSKGDDSGPAEG